VQELEDAGLLATPLRPTPRAIEAADLPQLTFLDAVCHESLRLFPPAPSGGARRLTKDTQACPVIADFL
jgi:cytochrome P450